MTIKVYEGPKNPYLDYRDLASRDAEGNFMPGRRDPEELLATMQQYQSHGNFDIWISGMSALCDQDLTFLKTGVSSIDWGSPIEVTTMRKVIAWVQAFFMAHDSVEVNRTPELEQRIRENQTEMFLFIGNIRGMKIIGEETEKSHCHSLVFRGEPWFNNEIQDTLLSGAEGALNFLQKKYAPVDRPSPGTIIAYGDRTMRHYGLIKSVNPDGTVTVVSKFAYSFLYEHPLEAILAEYGPKYTLFGKRL